MYKGPIATALQEHFPDSRKWTILEDNDPTGFRSKAGMKAEEKSGLTVLQIPKRSPQLNMCDYALWNEERNTLHLIFVSLVHAFQTPSPHSDAAAIFLHQRKLNEYESSLPAFGGCPRWTL